MEANLKRTGLTMAEKSLYERIGGIDAIAIVVDHFKVPERGKGRSLSATTAKRPSPRPS